MPAVPAPSLAILFDRLAGRYDLLNRLISLGQDLRWRRVLAGKIPAREGLRVLDLACGTGDQLKLLFRERPGIRLAAGVDISPGMLAIAQEKVRRWGLDSRVSLVRGDALALPFPDASFDAVTIAFGIRNLAAHRHVLFREIRRVLRPGGIVLILELTVPRSPIIRPLYRLYTRSIMPLIGGLVSWKFREYRYLNRSIEEFPSPETLCRDLRDAGFAEVSVSGMTLGVVRIWEGKREAPDGERSPCEDRIA